MGLSNDQIQKLVRERPSQREIQRGINHQRRLRFHTDTVLQKSDYFDAYLEYKRWIGEESPELLPRDKFDRFLHLLKPPIPTIELVESIYSRLHKVFRSQDAFFNYEFTNPELRQDWNEYRDKTFWATKGFQAMQSSIDSVWIADLPEFQKSSRPEPFNCLVDIEYVIDIENDEYLNCKHLIYNAGDFVVVYDDEYISVYANTQDNQKYSKGIASISISHEPVRQIAHGLGYTPARQFWSEQLEPRNFVNKESPITKELTDLDWLLFHMISKRYMDAANSYPIVVIRESDHDSRDEDITENKGRADGKRPDGNKLAGPGTIIEAPVPRGDQIDLMENPIKLIYPEVDNLDWHVREEGRLQNKIYRSVVGIDKEMLNDAAKNEKQVDSQFESQLAVLERIKRNYEIIHTFADSTLARMRYGKAFIKANIDYGTKFFLKDVNDLHEDFKLAKEAGASETILSEIQDNILNTKYREDSNSRQRAEIIRDLDPLPEKTIEETIQILDKGGIDKINFVIKCNLLNFVRRFERENINLVEFAANIDYVTKIETIKTKFKEYAGEFGQVDNNQGQ